MTLTVLDLFTRQCLDIAVGRGLTGQDVVATLERRRFDRGLPQRIYCDKGTEFVSAAMESFNGRLPRRVPERPLVRVAGGRRRQNRALAAGLR